MSVISWISRRLPADQARHAVVCAVIATAAAHVGGALGIHPALAAFWSGSLAGLALEVWQEWRGGVFGLNDLAADVLGSGLVALAVLA